MLAARLKNILFSLLAVEILCSTAAFIICCWIIYTNPERYGPGVLQPLFFLMGLFFILQFSFLLLFHQKIVRFSSFTHSISWSGFFTGQAMIMFWGLIFLAMELTWGTRPMAQIILGFTFGSMAAILILHAGVTTLLHALYNRKTNRLRILLVGMNKRTHEFCHVLKTTPHLGADVRGYLDFEPVTDSPIRYMGTPEDLNDVLHSQVIDVVFIFLPVRSYYDAIHAAIETSGFYGVTAHIVGNVFEADNVKKQPLCINDFGSLAFSSTSDDFAGLAVKRVLDILMSLAGIAALSPLLIAIALYIKLVSRGPVFFTQERVGFNKRIFPMIKFRTMVPDAEKRLQELTHLNEMDGPAFKITNDPRIIRGGNFLRRHSMDELPQLFNVLLGDMSVVGPRPLSKRDFDLLEEAWQRKRFSMRPGMTCIWQIADSRNSIPFKEWMQLDLKYIDGWSLGLDFSIIAKTIRAVVLGSGK